VYYCQDCKKQFKNKIIIIETHSLPSEPYERFEGCPHCKSTNVKKIPVKNCMCCGARMRGEGDYCSEACRKRGEYLWAKERSERERWAKHPLNLAIQEVERYNKETGKKLSYGQYFAGVR